MIDTAEMSESERLTVWENREAMVSHAVLIVVWLAVIVRNGKGSR